MKSEKFSLKWEGFQSTVAQSFSVLRQEEDFYDVTLVSDDQTQISAHKLVLSASSDFFRNILRKNKHSHPLLYLSGVKAQNLQCILDYIYLGEVNVFQGQLDEFLESAYKLNIRGLATVQTEDTAVKEEIQEIDPPADDVDVTEEETRHERAAIDAEEVTKLPCPIEFMSQLECQAWMNIELKKDFIEQELKPVTDIPWGKVAYTPVCWPHDKWPWKNASNPAQKAKIPPLGGLRKVDVYQQVIRNRLALKGKLTLQYLKEKMSPFWSKKSSIKNRQKCRL